jgi:dTDP-4-dehydrorhamnose reductase
MERMRSLGITPVIGLLHHGSGPRTTSLLDPAFPEKLAEYARAVAVRYPWAGLYTPINEPLTTARFSALYGLWYPHERDNLLFARAQILQCQAIVMAMRAIRDVNPHARLVQTEDLGKTHSTPELAYQAAMENERRWLTFDLLTGRVDHEHPMWPYYFRDLGPDEERLAWLRRNATAPDIIGVNHYLTSERFIDERLDHYPEHTHGGNGIHEYADVEAVRVMADGPAGPGTLLEEAWERYGIPLAITEVHLGCTREEQMRWLREIWDTARSLTTRGVDIRGVTAWSLLGAYDWQCLLTRDEGCYESGAYDVRSGTPRPTAIARMIAELAAGREPAHPVLEAPGWWRRRMRLIYPPSFISSGSTFAPEGDLPARHRRKILILGADGPLGLAIERACRVRGLACALLARGEIDRTDRAALEEAIDRRRPWAVVDAAGYTDVDGAELEPERCMLENAIGPETLASLCRVRGIQLLRFSSALVFDGTLTRPYVESDPVSPVSVYGQSMADGESLVLEELPEALVIRTGALFGARDQDDFVASVVRALAAGKTFEAAEDQLISPTYLPDLTNAALDLLIDGESGIWHLANHGEISWADLAHSAAELAGLDPAPVVRRSFRQLGQIAQRPPQSVLASARGRLMPALEDALRRYASMLAREEGRVGVHAARTLT